MNIYDELVRLIKDEINKTDELLHMIKNNYESLNPNITQEEIIKFKEHLEQLKQIMKDK